MYSSLRSASMQSKGTIPTCEVVNVILFFWVYEGE